MPKTLPKPWTQEWKAQYTSNHDDLEADLIERMRRVPKNGMSAILRGMIEGQATARTQGDDILTATMEFASYGLMHLIQVAYIDNQENPDA